MCEAKPEGRSLGVASGQRQLMPLLMPHHNYVLLLVALVRHGMLLVLHLLVKVLLHLLLKVLLLLQLLVLLLNLLQLLVLLLHLQLLPVLLLQPRLLLVTKQLKHPGSIDRARGPQEAAGRCCGYPQLQAAGRSGRGGRHHGGSRSRSRSGRKGG